MYKMLHMFPREKCNVVKYYLLNVASTRKPLAREGSRSRRRCHKVRDAIGIARVTCDSQFRREGDDSITHPPRFFFIAHCMLLSSPAASVCAIEGSHVWPADVSQLLTRASFSHSHVISKYSKKICTKFHEITLHVFNSADTNFLIRKYLLPLEKKKKKLKYFSYAIL